MDLSNIINTKVETREVLSRKHKAQREKELTILREIVAHNWKGLIERAAKNDIDQDYLGLDTKYVDPFSSEALAVKNAIRDSFEDVKDVFFVSYACDDGWKYVREGHKKYNNMRDGGDHAEGYRLCVTFNDFSLQQGVPDLKSKFPFLQKIVGVVAKFFKGNNFIAGFETRHERQDVLLEAFQKATHVIELSVPSIEGIDDDIARFKNATSKIESLSLIHI